MTTAPAPTSAPSPIVTPARIVALLPIEARRLDQRRHHRPVGLGLQAAVGVRPRAGSRSLVNITPWPTNTPSSIVTPSQMKVWLEILQLRPIDGALLDLDERADPRAVADRAAIEVDQIGVVDDDVLPEPYTVGNHDVLSPCAARRRPLIRPVPRPLVRSRSRRGRPADDASACSSSHDAEVAASEITENG